MDEKCTQWIDKFVDSAGQCLCEEYSYAMAKCFPELNRVGGLIYFANGESDYHYWCVDPKGNIVDPTAEQYMPEDDDDLDLYPKPWRYVPKVAAMRWWSEVEFLEEFYLRLLKDVQQEHETKEEVICQKQECR